MSLEIKFTLTDATIPFMEEMAEKRIKELDDKMLPFLIEKDHMLELLDEINHYKKKTKQAKLASQQNAAKADFESISTIIGKIIYILKESGRPMATRQILDRLHQLQPDILNSQAESQKMAKNVSTVLSINQGATEEENKKFIRITDDHGNYLFSLNPKHN